MEKVLIVSGENTEMKLKEYKEELLQRLQDPDYAASYLAEVIVNETQEDFLIAIKDVIDARGENISSLAEKAGITRQALYNSLSENGNPTLSTLIPILKSLGFCLTVASSGIARVSG